MEEREPLFCQLDDRRFVPLWWEESILLELLLEPLIDPLTDVVGEVMGGVGVFDDELVFGAEKVEDGLGGGDAFFDASYVEVGVAEGSVDVNAAGGDGGEDFGEVEWHTIGIVVIDLADFGHVAVAGPAFEVPLHVIVKRGKAAACDDGFQSRLKDGGEQGVVPAERMADDADVVGIDVAERFEQINGADVVPDSFHGAAFVERLVGGTLTPALSQREREFSMEVVVLVVAEAGIVRNQA